MESRSEFAEAFKSLALHGRDEISLVEMKAILCRKTTHYDAPFSEEEADETLKTFDINGDGKLNLAQFENFCLSSLNAPS